MNLKFDRSDSGEITVEINGKGMRSADYITIIKEVKEGKNIEAEYGSGVTAEEKLSIEGMLKEINGIDLNSQSEGSIQYPEDDIDPEDIPF